MNVVYSSSDTYAPIAGVSMYSLLCSNREVEELNIFVVDNQISEKNKNKFVNMCSDFGRSITFCPLSDLEKLAGTPIRIGRWNISTFGRLFEASILPHSVEKVIHIDCDTMITSSLEPLWNTDISGKTVIGALDCISDNYKTEIGMKPGDTYINAGNIVLNLKKIRKDGTEEKFRKYISEHSHLTYVDQTVLNACIPNGEKLVCPLEYNAYSILYYMNYKNLKRLRRVSSFYSGDEVKKAIEKPSIVHFTTCFMDGSRPWIENNVHPLLPIYLDYKKNSPWSDEPLWEDKRGSLKRLTSKILRALPQSLVACTIGIVHGILVPFINNIKH